MDKVEVLTLVSTTEAADEIGQQIPTETTRTVYCKIESITRAEWVAARQQELAPEAVCKVFFMDYSGERIAELKGKRYDIYRVFEDGDYIELYLGQKVGV